MSRKQASTAVMAGTVMLLMESMENKAVVEDPANEQWLSVLRRLDDARLEETRCRYHLALSHFRSTHRRGKLTTGPRVAARGRRQAQLCFLEKIDEQKRSRRSEDVFAPVSSVAGMSTDAKLPASLADFSVPPPPLRQLLGGPGRPPIDGACLMRAFLAAPVMGVDDDAGGVFVLLRSNPSFAHLCGFEGRESRIGIGELTSRQLPSLSVCEEFDEVMTRYGLWHLARVEQVSENIEKGKVELEDTLSFDTTHIKANSHCANVTPEDTGSSASSSEKKQKQRKVPIPRKTCSCGKSSWETCEHDWEPTDPGAAVVVKGPTRVYWAHKVSVVTFGESEVPIDGRVLSYAATHDGETLIPHLDELAKTFPNVIGKMKYVLADTAYTSQAERVRSFGQNATLLSPVIARSVSATLAERYAGIARFTTSGLPVCENGHRFEYLCRDTTKQTHVFAAPIVNGVCVCASCPYRNGCLEKGQRRHIRVPKADLVQIDWNAPQHLSRNKKRYRLRTGVERAIKRLKVDLGAERLGHRNALRVQAHVDKRLLALHVLLAAQT